MTYDLTNSTSTSNATSSPASAVGASPCASTDGPTTGLSGPAPVLASLSARQAKEMGLLTSGTYGPHGTGSSSNAGPKRYVASKSLPRTVSGGSTLYALTWKERVTPCGRKIAALRAQGRRTSGNGSGSALNGWPTPVVNDDGKSPEAHLAMKQRMGERDGTGANRTAITSLQVLAQLAGWPTPMAGSPGTETYNPAGSTDYSRKVVELAGWNTARATDGANGGPNQSGGALPADAALAGWPTATTRDWKDGGNPDMSIRRAAAQFIRDWQADETVEAVTEWPDLLAMMEAAE